MKKIKIMILSGLEDEFKLICEDIISQNPELECYFCISSINIVEKIILLYDLFLKEKEKELDIVKSIPPGKGFLHSNQVKKREQLSPLYFYSDKISEIIINYHPDYVLLDLFTGSVPFTDLNPMILFKHVILKFEEKCRRQNHQLINELIQLRYKASFHSIFSCQRLPIDEEFKLLASTCGIINIDENINIGIISYKQAIERFFREIFYQHQKDKKVPVHI